MDTIKTTFCDADHIARQKAGGTLVMEVRALREASMLTISIRTKVPTAPTNFGQRIFYSGYLARHDEARMRAAEFVNQHRI